MPRRTKIVCTIGPATSSPARLEELARAGMDVARLNFSHGAHEEHAAIIAALRAIADRIGRPLAILQDLSGPKIRLGSIAAPIDLRRGQAVVLTTRDVPGDEREVSLPVPEMVAALQPGERLFVDDGRVQLTVVSVDGPDVTARVVVPGPISSHKGIAAPGVVLDIPAVTAKDLDDLRFGLAQGVDWVAASYVRAPEDLAPLRRTMEEVGLHRPLVAKIERREAVHRIEDIVECVDGIMVARGDLGVEVPIDEVPILQKRIIRLCNRAGKPVITATQMLDSMMHNPRPTRAEVTDVANAILDGTDAVMLSGETAVGEYPRETVRMMARVAAHADACLPASLGAAVPRPGVPPVVSDAVALATVEMARSLRAAAIICATTSGSTARRIAQHRPHTPLVGVTPTPETYRQLALTWGVRPVLVQAASDTDRMMEEAIGAVVDCRLARAGNLVILTAGVPVNAAGNTNLIRVHRIGEPIAQAR